MYSSSKIYQRDYYQIHLNIYYLRSNHSFNWFIIANKRIQNLAAIYTDLIRPKVHDQVHHNKLVLFRNGVRISCFCFGLLKASKKCRSLGVCHWLIITFLLTLSIYSRSIRRACFYFPKNSVYNIFNSILNKTLFWGLQGYSCFSW